MLLEPYSDVVRQINRYPLPTRYLVDAGCHPPKSCFTKRDQISTRRYEHMSTREARKEDRDPQGGERDVRAFWSLGVYLV